MKKSKPKRLKISFDHGDEVTELFIINPGKLFVNEGSTDGTDPDEDKGKKLKTNERDH